MATSGTGGLSIEPSIENTGLSFDLLKSATNDIGIPVTVGAISQFKALDANSIVTGNAIQTSPVGVTPTNTGTIPELNQMIVPELATLDAVFKTEDNQFSPMIEQPVVPQAKDLPSMNDINTGTVPKMNDNVIE